MQPPSRKTSNATVAKRPMATVRHVALVSQEVIERLSRAGVDILLAQMSRLSEGQVIEGRYFGSTMLTLDVRRLEGRVRESCDVATAMRLARLWSRNDGVLESIRQLAHDEAERLAGTTLEAPGFDVRVRADGSWLFVDVDVEGQTQEARALRRAGS